MQIEPLLILLLIGAVAGYLAGIVVKGYGYGLVGNIVVGVVGAVIGGWLLPRLGLYTGGDIIGQIVAATLGAIALLVALGLVRRVT
ncbi:MAG: GlsB/YeaQ/YmgE family stress response membrane protein [Hyphomicrobiaceae bacterium]|nr:GlsB/YeaQ/YmgE family stress response membrane protein [Hyphomicrobiaceae bacterium]